MMAEAFAAADTDGDNIYIYIYIYILSFLIDMFIFLNTINTRHLG